MLGYWVRFARRQQADDLGDEKNRRFRRQPQNGDFGQSKSEDGTGLPSLRSWAWLYQMLRGCTWACPKRRRSYLWQNLPDVKIVGGRSQWEMRADNLVLKMKVGIVEIVMIGCRNFEAVRNWMVLENHMNSAFHLQGLEIRAARRS